MTTEITMPEKDSKRLAAMVETIKRKPESANEFLTYAYGLGYCHGRIVTATEFREAIDAHSPSAASPPLPEEK